jgi:Carboxypeptidase regulatory-like domain/TonB-dependent Receptor Plug Domain
MTANSQSNPRLSSAPKWIRNLPWLLIPILALSFTVARAQQLTATLSGSVTDQTEARVPGAKVSIVNEATADTRTTVADSSGFFSVTALIPGTYSVSISAKGFAPWKETGVLLNQGDTRNIPAIKLSVGGAGASVTVISGEDAEIPTDNAEISSTLNNELVDSATLTGRNAAELIKMMPGITFNNGGGAGSAYNSQVTGTNNGPAGNFSANGAQPYGSTAVILDGANLIDPGNAGTQVANINQDMTDSVKYLSASYGAEYAKGPTILQAFSKSGTQKFHGEGYLYARNSAVGFADDAFAHANNTPVEPQQYYYVGGNVGGPIFFPHFNKNRDKLFFWGGYEYMNQHPYYQPVYMNVLTDAQRGGDFSNAGVSPNVINSPVNQYAYTVPCPAASWNGCNNAQSPWLGGDNTNLSPYFDPNYKILEGLIPTANVTPSVTNGWQNYQFINAAPQNRWEGTGKVTYALSDNNKLWGSYAHQSEIDTHPVNIWWAPGWTIPYPGGGQAHETADVVLANFTHVFNPTTTNEFVFSYAKFVNPTKLTDPNSINPASNGFPTGTLFGGKTPTQMTNINGSGTSGNSCWNCGLIDMYEFSFDSGIYGKNSFGKTSKTPAISDTFTKIIKTHSVKAGFYWDEQENLQSPSGDFNGTNNYSPWGGTGTGNIAADLLLGNMSSYAETNIIPIPDYAQHQWSLWGQDQWKATRKMTFNLGLRLDHEGQWYDKIGDTQVWDQASYVNSYPAPPPANTGLIWHKNASRIPISGFKSPLFFYNPRLGVAYDLFGNGKTVVRGGFGTYRYQISSNDAGGAMNGPLGSFEYNTGSAGYVGYANLLKAGFVTPVGLNQVGATISADKQGDSKVPYANTYSFGIAQALPGHTVMQASYVGSMSRNQLENGSNGHISDANPIPIGAFFGPDPKQGNQIINPSTNGFNANDYFALYNYQHIWIITHGGWANYNSLQVAAQKQSGNLFLFTNFTFGKVLGTRDGNTSNGNGNGTASDPWDLGANYGELAYDHTKTFNLSFSYKLPKPVHNAFLGQIVNGWQLSGYTTYEDGAPMFPNSSGNLFASYSCKMNSSGACDQSFTMPNGLVNTQAPSYTTWFGSNQWENSLQPLLLFNPKKGLKKNQYWNPNAFAAPQYGVNGPYTYPYIKEPHYWGSDMAIFKAFRVTDSQRAEIRISATNWLNHPNAQFGLAGNGDQTLSFVGASDSSGLVTNSNPSATGIPENKAGYRWMQFAAKYYF